MVVMPAPARPSNLFSDLSASFSSIPMRIRVLAILLIAFFIGLNAPLSMAQTNAEPEMRASMPASSPRRLSLARNNMQVVSEAAMASDADFGMARGEAAPMAKVASRGGRPSVLAADGGTLPEEVTRTRIIETGHGNILVDHYRTAVEQAHALVKEAGGSIASQNERDLSGDGVYGAADITYRVPVEKFRSTWSALLKLGKKVIHSSTNAEDITEQFVDTAIRIKNLEATHAKLLMILSNASSVHDTLMVHRELSSIAGDLEALKGRLNYLDRRSSMSTINMHIENDINYRPPRPPQPPPSWSPLRTLIYAINSLGTVAMIIADGLIFLVVFGVPVLVVLMLVAGVYSTVQNRVHSS